MTSQKAIPAGFTGVEGADAFRSKLKFQVQHEVFRVKVREGRIGEITEILAWYEYINDVILDHLDDEIKSTDRSGVWRYLISFKVRVLSGVRGDFVCCSESAASDREHRDSVCVRDPLPHHGQRHPAELHQVSGDKRTGPHGCCRYVEHDTLIWEYLNSSIHLAPYLEKKFRRIYAGEAYRFYRQR